MAENEDRLSYQGGRSECTWPPTDLTEKSICQREMCKVDLSKKCGSYGESYSCLTHCSFSFYSLFCSATVANSAMRVEHRASQDSSDTNEVRRSPLTNGP